MKKINYVVLFVFALVISVSSCKKDESTSDKILSTSEQEKQMLTAHSWKLSSLIENRDTVVVPDCEKDDVYTFLADGTFSHEVGALICASETNSSGTWNLTLDLRFTFNGIPTGFVITDSKLVLETKVDIDGTITAMTLVPR